ncbi:hypothetical protein [Paenarthrobacter sp. YJN-5]|nr:hypothetical protein [Paenarthrobacter sp. YJN-5]
MAVKRVERLHLGQGAAESWWVVSRETVHVDVQAAQSFAGS